ncbi:MAG: thermonuclease family protein [Nitrospinae bacterium]|nr:thermonuclease family protein [Nitrospinota bacterium]
MFLKTHRFVAPLLLIGSLLLLMAPPALAQEEEEPSLEQFVWGKGTSVEDGDTLTIKDDRGKAIRVQLAYLDAPDLDVKSGEAQPLHAESKKKLEELTLGKALIVEKLEVDRFGRILGMVFLDKLNVNLEMLRLGLAEIYFPVRVHPERYNAYYITDFRQTEARAKERKVGIWGRPDYVSPYQFRRRIGGAGG